MEETFLWSAVALGVGWAAYLALHSLLATLRLKRWVQTHWPQAMPWYRLAYNTLAIALLLPLLWAKDHWPGPLLWQWEGAWVWVRYGVNAGLLLGVLASLRDYNLGEVAGLRQARKRIMAVEDQERFRLGVLHRFVRHPWYALALLYIWSRDFNGAFLVTAVCWTVYLVVGSRLEEGRLSRVFGEPYRRYRQKVPGLLPLPWRWLNAKEASALSGAASAGTVFSSTPFGVTPTPPD